MPSWMPEAATVRLCSSSRPSSVRSSQSDDAWPWLPLGWRGLVDEVGEGLVDVDL